MLKFGTCDIPINLGSSVEPDIKFKQHIHQVLNKYFQR